MVQLDLSLDRVAPLKSSFAILKHFLNPLLKMKQIHLKLYKTKGPWTTIRSPDNNSYCISANACNFFQYCHITWHKFDHTVKRSKVIIWTNLVDTESPMLYTKIQPQSFLSSGEEDCKSVLPYMGMAAILSNDAKPLEWIVKILSTEGPMKIVQRRKYFKISLFYTYTCTQSRGKGR